MTNEELVISIQQGTTAHIPVLWEQVSSLVGMLAWRYFNRLNDTCAAAGVTLEDLKQEGYFAMLAALEAWTPESGCQFSTFLNYPLLTQFNTLCGIRTKKIDLLNHTDSLDRELPGTDDLFVSDTVPDPDAEIDFDEVEREIYNKKLLDDLNAALKRMEPQRRKVIKQHYLEGQTLTDISKNMGIPHQRAQQLKRDALRKLRQNKDIIQYMDEIMCKWSYRRGSLAAYKHSFASSVELAAEQLDRIERELYENPERVKEMLDFE